MRTTFLVSLLIAVFYFVSASQAAYTITPLGVNNTLASTNTTLYFKVLDQYNQPPRVGSRLRAAFDWASYNSSIRTSSSVYLWPSSFTNNTDQYAIDTNGTAAIPVFVGFNPGNFTVNLALVNDSTTARSYSYDVTPAKKEWAAIAIVIVMSVLLIFVSFATAAWILRQDDGTQKMREVSDPIKEGAEGFFRTQYMTIGALAIPVAVILFILYIVRPVGVADPQISKAVFAVIVAVSFLLGAFFSALAGLAGMWVAVRANIRVASAARNSYNGAVNVALRSGAFAGFLVVSMSVLGVMFLFAVLYGAIHPTDVSPYQIPLLLVGYGFGASFVALFAQVGGGIYTKAADVGADIIGKVEANIPEDDIRNPAVIADLVGDNVGDCAGRGADLFESIAAENIGAMILAGTLAYKAYPQISTPISYIIFPLMIHMFGLILSSIGIAFVKVKEPSSMGRNAGTERKPLIIREDDVENTSSSVSGEDLDDPMNALNKGYAITVVLAIGVFIGITYWLLDTPNYPGAWWKFAICGIIGIVISWLFVFITIYYTDFKWGPVRRIADASKTGAGTNVIAGLSVGLESTTAPVLIICVGILSTYWIGKASGITDASGTELGGLFGTAVATMGMLSSAGFILAMDTFGPITDNAGGIVEMSQLPPEVRVITDRLDAVGNTTKALTKGYAIGSAALAAFLLFSAFLDEIANYLNEPFASVDLALPEVFVGALIGAGLVFLFSALTIRAVGKSAETVIHEVRRQFREKPGILTYEAKPDYKTCVAIVAKSALIQMIIPGLLPVLVPIIVGFVFRGIGAAHGNDFYGRTLGAQVSAGFLMVATITGILMALFLNNAGGAWDNAKKFVEMGFDGGKGSDTHKAAVIGDTVGDPCKDTAGPSIHVLIKLLATITLVMGPFFVAPAVTR